MFRESVKSAVFNMTKLRASVAKASSAQAEQTNPLTEEFGEFARKTLKEFNVPGVSIVVIDGDNIFAEVRIPPLNLISYNPLTT